MKAVFVKLDWKRCGAPVHVQGVKGGRVPYGAVAGGNGSFVVCDPAEVHIETIGEDGEHYRSSDIIQDIRNFYNRRNITEKVIETVIEMFEQSSGDIEIDENGDILNLTWVLTPYFAKTRN